MLAEKHSVAHSGGGVRVVIENIGEGEFGDFDPTDPTDVNYVRFTVYYKGDTVDDASYCTRLPADEKLEVFKRAANYIYTQVAKDVTKGKSIKKKCEKLSWMDSTWFRFNGGNADTQQHNENKQRPARTAQHKSTLRITEGSVTI